MSGALETVPVDVVGQTELLTEGPGGEGGVEVQGEGWGLSDRCPREEDGLQEAAG